MNRTTHDEHASAEQLQALLEGELPSRDLAWVEEHLAGCVRCASELDAWKVLFEDLGDLSSHRPHEGFAERVMASVQLPEPVSMGERVLGHLHQLTGGSDAHVASDILQDFLDGTLAARKAEGIERHLAGCGACAGEAEAWLGVMRRLDGLESFAPADGFADRVMAGVDIRQPSSLAARARSAVLALFGGPVSVSEHVPAGILQDLVDGALPSHAVARIEAHMDDCSRCAAEQEAWRNVATRLDTLDRFAPSEGFSDRVMEALEPATAVAARRPPVWSRALAAARSLVPQTRRAWAALSGVAVTPAVVVGLVVYTVFSHPTLTIGSLVSFAWWQTMDLAGSAVSALGTVALRSSEAFGLYSLFEVLASAPALVAGAVLAYTIVSALALRVLYKNLITRRPSNGRYAHVSTS